MPDFTARYFDEVEDEKHTREVLISANDAKDAQEIADQGMRPHEKRVQLDEHAVGGSKNTTVMGRPEDRE